jgi:hypothetical protein
MMYNELFLYCITLDLYLPKTIIHINSSIVMCSFSLEQRQPADFHYVFLFCLLGEIE